jgi:hypothetical protein
MGKKRRPRKYFHIGLGPVICPKCGQPGWLGAGLQQHLTTGTIFGPYFDVAHSSTKSLLNAKDNPHRVIVWKLGPFKRCYLGKLTLDKLDHVVKRRPYPTTAQDTINLIHHRMEHPLPHRRAIVSEIIAN